MTRFKVLGLLACMALLSACASTEFRAFEGRNNSYEGRGGTKVVVDGMEVWETGEPPRRFSVLGVIQDERPGAVIPMAQMRGDIVKKARQAGGDAVIQAGSQSQIAGYYSSGTATASSFGNSTSANASAFAMPVRRNSASFVVIKYLEPTPNATLSAPATQAPTEAGLRQFAGYWNVIFSGTTAGDCLNLLIDVSGQVSGTCRLAAGNGTYVPFTVIGAVDAAGVAKLSASTGATMSGVFSAQAGSGGWNNGTASGAWNASRI